MRRLLSAVAVIAVLTALLQNPFSATSASAASSTLAEGFNDGGSSWITAIGTATVAGSTSDKTEGTSSLTFGYNVSSTSAEIGRKSTPTLLPDVPLEQLTLDVKGDSTFNTLYLRLRDATGEVFMYRMGTLDDPSWTSMSVDLSSTPAHVDGGNENGILDAPLSFYRLAVTRNGSQPAVGEVKLDNLRVTTGDWTLGVSGRDSMIAGNGTIGIELHAGAPGDYRLVLADLSGRSRTYSGTADAGVVGIAWNGKTSGGTSLSGVVSAVLEYDSTPDSSLDTALTRYGDPYFLAVTARQWKASPGTPVAVNGTMTTLDSPQAVDAQAKLMEDAYVGYSREEFEWNRIEPRNDYFDWPKFDQTVAIASARNVHLIGKLVYTADWATSAPAGTSSSQLRYYPPNSMSDYADYVRQVVERYKDTVTVWEVWNEPNHNLYWKPSPDPVAYTELLKTAYQTIKSVQPQSTVILGGVAGFNEPYMQGLVAAGAIPYFDALGLHTYVANAPEQGITDTWLNAAQSYLARYAPDRQIWITEVGWSTCTTGCPLQVTEAQQAEYLSRAYVYYVSRGIRSVAWFNMIELGDSGTQLDNFGLVERSGRQKPAYHALARTAAVMYQTVSGGVLSPTAGGTSTKVNDFATRSDFSVEPIGGGFDTLEVTIARHTGDGGLKLSYDFSGSARGVGINFSQPVTGSPSALSLWVFGDTSNSSVYLKFADATGERFEAKICNAALREWTRCVFYMDGANSNFSHVGGDNDGVVDYPLTVSSINIYESTNGISSGEIHLDDLTAHYGAITRGTVLAGAGVNVQAIYSPAASNLSLPVVATPARLRDVDVYQQLTVTDGLAAVAVSGVPRFVVNELGVSPGSPQVGSPVTFTWQSADRSRLTIQITKLNGASVRTLAVRQGFEASQNSFTWDGRTSAGSLAAAGDYKIRIDWYAADGRATFVTREFSLE